MKNSCIRLLALVMIVGCSSNSKHVQDVKHSNFEKDYVVRDASMEVRPGWIVDATDWAKENYGDEEKYQYYSFETTPKIDREVACSLAKTKARVDIAGEISSFIEKSLAESQEGQSRLDPSHPENSELKDFVEVNLAERTQAMLNGVQILKTYWENRDYQQKKASGTVYQGYTCAVLARILKEDLKGAVEEAKKKLVDHVQDPKVKENVETALKSVGEDFVKSRKGEI